VFRQRPRGALGCGVSADVATGVVSRFSLRREFALGLGVYALYLAVSRFVLRRRGRERAAANAALIVALEERLGVQVEPAVQRALLRYPGLVHGLNLGYGLFNVTLTLGWLVLLFRRRDASYHRFRRACLLAHVGAQPAFLLLPTAPPRVLDGFVDTLSEVSGLDLEHPLLVRFYNPVAAMPSLHVAFAVVTGAEIAARSDSLLVKTVAHAYAPLVAAVVAGTGNHYVLDAVGGAALGAAARRLA
jgi:PAP2 superfamily